MGEGGKPPARGFFFPPPSLPPPPPFDFPKEVAPQENYFYPPLKTTALRAAHSSPQSCWGFLFYSPKGVVIVCGIDLPHPREEVPPQRVVVAPQRGSSAPVVVVIGSRALVTSSQ